LGFSKIAPPSTWATRVNSCVGSWVGVGHFDVRVSARPCQGSSPVPPSRFLTVLVVCSACCLAGLLHPAADPGVRRVSGRPSGSLRFRRGVPSSSALQPFEAFPLSAAVPLSRAPAFLPFAFRKSGRFDFKALLHGSSPPRQQVLPPTVARCFLGLFFHKTRKRVHLFRDLHRSLVTAVPWGLVLSHVPPGLGASCEVPGRWCGCRFLLPKQREARGAVGPFRSRFRSVPDASIRSRLENARGVGPCLSLVAMTPAAQDFNDSLEI
jgi:hypothetical protein